MNFLEKTNQDCCRTCKPKQNQNFQNKKLICLVIVYEWMDELYKMFIKTFQFWQVKTKNAKRETTRDQ